MIIITNPSILSGFSLDTVTILSSRKQWTVGMWKGNSWTRTKSVTGKFSSLGRWGHEDQAVSWKDLLLVVEQVPPSRPGQEESQVKLAGGLREVTVQLAQTWSSRRIFSMRSSWRVAGVFFAIKNLSRSRRIKRDLEPLPNNSRLKWTGGGFSNKGTEDFCKPPSSNSR